MNFEGSITPPLSDDETCILEDQNAKSPILKVAKSSLPHTRPKIWYISSNIAANLGVVLLANKHKTFCKDFVAKSDVELKKFKITNTTNCARIDDYFYKSKQELMLIEKQIRKSLNSTLLNEDDLFIHKFLSKVKVLISKDNTFLKHEKLSCILENLFSLSNDASSVMDYGVSCLPRTLVSGDSTGNFLHQCENSCLILWFHLYCCINTILLELATIIATIDVDLPNFEVCYSDGVPVTAYNDILFKTLNRVLHDIAFLSFNYFQSIYVPESGLTVETFSRDPFLCSCVEKLFKKCHLLFKKEEDFWSMMMSIINNVIKTSNKPDESSTSSSLFYFKSINIAIAFSWWWIQRMPFNSGVTCCHSIVNRLLRLSFSNFPDSDHQLSCFLACYFKILTSVYKSLNGRDWSSVEIAGFNLVWQNVSQRLSCAPVNGANKDTTFYNLTDMSLEKWLIKFKLLESTVDDIHTPDSFAMFLSLFYFLMSKKQGNIWILLKERFFLRFQLPALKQLNLHSLGKFFYLVFIILRFCPFHTLFEALQNCMSFLDHYNLDKLDLSKQKIYVSGLYMIMLICKQRQIDYTCVSMKTGKYFEKTLKSYFGKLSLNEVDCDFFGWISHYLNLFSELLQMSEKVDNSQLLLLQASHIQILFNPQRVVICQELVDFFSEVIYYLKLQMQNHKSDFSSISKFFLLLVNKTLPWFQCQVTSRNKNLNLYDVIADVTILLASIASHDDGSLSLLHNMWSYFGNNRQFVSPQSCQYLTKCLMSSSFATFLSNRCHSNAASANCTSFDDCAIQGWIKSIVLLSVPESSNLRSLTMQISKLKVLEDLIDSDMEEFSFEYFLNKLSYKHKTSKDFLSRVAWSDKAKSWFNPCLESAAQALTCETSTQSSYSILSSIILHCSLVLHTKKPSFVTRVVDNFIFLPSVKQTHLVDNCIHKYLDKFILGLVLIKERNSYIDHALKKIFNLYLTRWSCGTEMSDHPFVRLLYLASTHHVTSMTLFYFGHILEKEPLTDKLAMVVEILYFWSTTTSSDQDNLPSFLAFLKKIRPQLRFNLVLLKKLDHLMTVFI